jgi:hypothetical protein
MIFQEGWPAFARAPAGGKEGLGEMNPSDKTPAEPGGAIDPTEYVLDAWLAFVRDPDNGFVPLRNEIRAMLYRFLRPLNLGGFFDGLFDGIVREALLGTLSRFLTGNRRLVEATRSGNRGIISMQLLRSIWLALQTTVWRTRTLANRRNTVTAPAHAEAELQAHVRLCRDIVELALSQNH